MATDSEVWSERFTCILGAVRYSDLLYLALQEDAVDPNTEPHFFPVTFDRGSLGSDMKIPWTPVGLTVCMKPLEQMICVGEDGEAFSLGSGSVAFESIHAHGLSPLDRGGPLRNVGTVGGCAYAVGMRRQVYQRKDVDGWHPIDEAIYSNSQEVVGFESIDGFSDNEIYTVGWEGEIWCRRDDKWQKMDSPTNLILTDVCCGGDGIVYICGQLGTLLKGDGEAWTVIDTGITENIWSIAWYGDRLYMATFSGLFALVDDRVERVVFGDDKPLTFYHLSAADGLLCSFGGKDVMTFDGNAWTRVV